MYLARNGVVGFTGDSTHASKGVDGFTQVAGHIAGRRRGLAGLRDDGPSNTSATRLHAVEGAGGPGCGARGRQQILAGHISDTAPQAPSVWRAPEGAGGPGCGARGRWRGLAGLRDEAPSEARSASSRGRAAAHGHTKQPGLTKHIRRPEHQRRHKQHHSQAYKKPTPAIGCRFVVELGGFEPPTFSLRTRRATNCAIAPRTRTA